MSQTKYPIVKIRSKNPDLPPTGANTLVEIDGEPFPTACFVKVECHARRMTKVTIEMYAHAEIETMGDLTTKVIPLVPKEK